MVVCTGFVGAGVLIGKSYKEWQEAPIATSITTHPIDHLDFPAVTICPPKGSNTALYHDLVKAGAGPLSDKDRTALSESAYKIFIKPAHIEYMEQMLDTTNVRNLDQVYRGFHSLPKPITQDGLEIKMWNLNGTITSPGYGGEFVEEYYKEDRQSHLVLELPDDIKEKVGSGSLLIELEVETRKESLWDENVVMYTLHQTEKTWTEAEVECQNEGAHLASVTSEEVNEHLIRVAGSNYFWLGGRKESGEWSWSDNSTWGYTKWERGSHEDYCCIRMESYDGTWATMSISSSYAFICQVEYKPQQRNEKLTLKYNKDQLTFTSFHVWYNYKTVSQQWLDSLQDKRMTGFKLSWRIENPALVFTTTISEIGRSIQTPRLGESQVIPADALSDHVYKVTLMLPEDIQQQVGDGSLVIEMDVDKKQADEVFAFTSFKRYAERKNWTEADTHCKSVGGQLASIHSEWEQTLAERASNGNWVWLGGRKDAKENQWQWADNSTWGFTNWDSDRPDAYDRMQMKTDGEWYDYSSSNNVHFLCQGQTVTLTEGVELKKEQLNFFPFYVLFKSQAISHRMSNSSSAEERRMTGFNLHWFLKDSNGTQLTEKLPPKQEDWKPDGLIPAPKYVQPLLAEMVQLARHLRVKHNKTNEQILEKVIRWKIENIGILTESRKCSMNQIGSEHLEDVFLKLVPSFDKEDLEGSTSDEDITTGFGLFHAVVFCPSSLEMDSKYFQFVDQLLSNESSRTIIQTFVNMFHSGIIKDATRIAQTKEFYDVLATTLNLQYGDILLATASKSQLQAVIDNDWPFFTNHTDLVKTCLKDSDCDSIQDIAQKLGSICCWFADHTKGGPSKKVQHPYPGGGGGVPYNPVISLNFLFSFLYNSDKIHCCRGQRCVNRAGPSSSPPDTR